MHMCYLVRSRHCSFGQQRERYFTESSSVTMGVAVVAVAGGETPTAGVSPPASFAQNCTEYRINLLPYQLRLRQTYLYNHCTYIELHSVRYTFQVSTQ